MTVQSQPGVMAWLLVDVRQLTPRSRRNAICTMVGLALLSAVVAYVIYTQAGPHHGQYDLRIYYSATGYWLSGGRLYDYWQPDPVNGTLGFTYPPTAAILMAPMHAFNIDTVVVLNFIATIACSILCLFLWLRDRMTWGFAQLLTLAAVCSAAAVCFQPFAQTVAFGQINLYLTALVSVDVLVLSRRGSRWSGVCIGLAAAIKLTPGIFILYYVYKRDWRSLSTCILSFSVVSVCSAVLAPSESLRYFTDLLWNSQRVGLLDNTTNQSINGFLARWSGNGSPDKITWFALSLLALGLLSWRIRSALAARDDLCALVLIGFCGLLVSPVSWLHHATWVVPAAIILISRLWAGRTMFSSRPEVLPPGSAIYRHWFLSLAVLVTGLWVWFKDTRVVFDLPDTGYARLGLLQHVEGNAQLLWLIGASAVLTQVPARLRKAILPNG